MRHDADRSGGTRVSWIPGEALLRVEADLALVGTRVRFTYPAAMPAGRRKSCRTVCRPPAGGGGCRPSPAGIRGCTDSPPSPPRSGSGTRRTCSPFRRRRACARPKPPLPPPGPPVAPNSMLFVAERVHAQIVRTLREDPPWIRIAPVAVTKSGDGPSTTESVPVDGHVPHVDPSADYGLLKLLRLVDDDRERRVEDDDPGACRGDHRPPSRSSRLDRHGRGTGRRRTRQRGRLRETCGSPAAESAAARSGKTRRQDRSGRDEPTPEPRSGNPR